MPLNPYYSWKYIFSCIILQFSRRVINYHSDIWINENTGNEAPLYLRELLNFLFSSNMKEEEATASPKAWTPQTTTVFWPHPVENKLQNCTYTWLVFVTSLSFSWALHLFPHLWNTTPPVLFIPSPTPKQNKIFYTCWLIIASLSIKIIHHMKTLPKPDIYFLRHSPKTWNEN